MLIPMESSVTKRCVYLVSMMYRKRIVNASTAARASHVHSLALLNTDCFNFAVAALGLEMTNGEYRKLWRRFDTSGDGSISYAEVSARDNQPDALACPPTAFDYGRLLLAGPQIALNACSSTTRLVA